MSEYSELERRVTTLEDDVRTLQADSAVVVTRVSVLEHDVASIEKLTTRLNAISDAQQSLEVELNTLIALSKQHAEALNTRVRELSTALEGLRNSHVERNLTMERAQKNANLSLALGLLAFAGVVLGIVFQFIPGH